MKKSFKNITLLVAFSLLSFYLGGLLGFSNRQLDDSAANAMLLTLELRKLREQSNPLTDLIEEKELALDIELVQLAAYQQKKPVSLLYWPLSTMRDHNTYLKIVADYRQQHPSPASTLGVDAELASSIQNAADMLLAPYYKP